jgi:hypothetical protein
VGLQKGEKESGKSRERRKRRKREGRRLWKGRGVKEM